MFPELFLILVILIPLFAVVLESPVAQAIATRLERRDTNGAPEQTIDRIAYLEAEVDPIQAFAAPVMGHMNADHAESTVAMCMHYIGLDQLDAARRVEAEPHALQRHERVALVPRLQPLRLRQMRVAVLALEAPRHLGAVGRAAPCSRPGRSGPPRLE